MLMAWSHMEKGDKALWWDEHLETVTGRQGWWLCWVLNVNCSKKKNERADCRSWVKSAVSKMFTSPRVFFFSIIAPFFSLGINSASMPAESTSASQATTHMWEGPKLRQANSPLRSQILRMTVLVRFFWNWERSQWKPLVSGNLSVWCSLHCTMCPAGSWPCLN